MTEFKPLSPVSMGQPLTRVDGRLKVTGAATYAHEFRPPSAAHAWLVGSTIARGTIQSIDSAAAEKIPGVLAVLTHRNAPKLKAAAPLDPGIGILLEERMPLSDAVISYGGQVVALVVATSLEVAREAAGRIRIAYLPQKPLLDWDDAAASAQQPVQSNGQKLQVRKGRPEEALGDPLLAQIDAVYSTPVETHNPIECSATTAVWERPDALVLYDSTQHVKGVQAIVSAAFGLKREQVRVICPFVGGAFGCKGPVWPHTFLAVMAAKLAGVPVKLELTRALMFSGSGHRSPTRQRIVLVAERGGKLRAIRHLTESVTSPVGSFVETCGFGGAKILYDAPAIEFGHTVYKVNVAQPSFMRAPGEAPGTFAFECAMDELAVKLGMDPVVLRGVNETRQHPIDAIPFSTHNLARCYALGAERFGWARRTPEPRSMRQGGELIGWGVATATYPANKWAATVRIRLQADGSAKVACATHDLGTGAYTVCTQIAADALGLAAAQIHFELGSSDLPEGPVAGGSNSTATVGSAIVLAAEALLEKLARLAVADEKSALHGAAWKDVGFVAPGQLGLRGDSARREDFVALLARARVPELVAEGSIARSQDTRRSYHSFGAHFCEVRIDRDLPMVRVTRVVSVIDCGRVINPKTGSSQIVGGVMMGIGMALSEETRYDRRTGLPVTRNLADYHVPVNADAGAIEVLFAGEPDLAFNPMGARGMGEIGTTGIAAAIANAVFHATAKRVRELPITPDKLL